VHKIGKIVAIKVDGDGGKCFVQAGGEGQRKGLSVVIKSLGGSSCRGFSRHEDQVLHLVFFRCKQIITMVQNISAVRAHSLGAINIAVGGIALALTNLFVVPVAVNEGLSLIEEQSGLVIRPVGSKHQILNVFASSVTRAIIGASEASTGFAFIAVKAVAFSSGTITHTLSSAFRILVVASRFIRSINPSNFVGANTIGAITTVMGQTNAPVIITVADLISHAVTMATALIIATSVDSGNQNKKRNKLYK